MKMSSNYRIRIHSALLVAAGLLTGASATAADFNLRMQTDLGAIDLLMLETVAPLTVANFMNYVNRGDYDGTFLHRSVPGFIVQGGGYIFDGIPGTFLSGGTTHIPEDPPVVNEFNLSNLRATLSMAKLGSNPDSATSEFFFNLADNSANLDAQNGGFTVFSQVTGTGMNVVDAIAMLPTCPAVAPFFVCNQAYTSALPLADGSGLDDTTVINIYIGADGDQDGAIDRLEDAGPNAGDGNLDTVQDSQQQHVATYPAGSSESVVLVAPVTNPLQSLSHMDMSFYLANPGSTYELLTLAVANGMKVTRGFAGYEITGVGLGGASTVTMTLPAGDTPDTFFNYGPTPSSAVADWYPFDFDGTTGAQISANVITLQYVDGLRGDDDLTADGVITVSPGGAGLVPIDLDGVDAAVEDGGPNGGDGNNDTVPDSQQGNVATFITTLPGVNDYITIESMIAGQALNYVRPLDGSTLNLSSVLNDFNFQQGFFEIHVTRVPVGGMAEIQITLPQGAAPDTYFMYGPEPGNALDHWYQFDYNGTTGAVINGNVVTLHFVDGQRGDADLTANGIIADPGGPATAIANANLTTAGGGGGCSVANQHVPGSHAGAWMLLLLGLILRRMGRR
jgi:cyclophilin family peptidyl-prolyl cis-trans isomerase